MKFVTANCSIGYPVYGAKFLNNRMLLVAGGGGEGNNGIPNKLTVLRVDFAKKKVIKRFREITLDPNDDSPTTLDVANDTILVGCNENSQKIKEGEGNHHLRKFLFENEHLKFVAGIDFDRSRQPEDYTRLISLSRDGSVGAIASSAIPTVIRIIDPKELTEKYEIETGHEVKDMHFAPDGKVISYITASTLEVISIVTGRFIIRKTDFDPNYSLSKIKFLTDDVVLIAAALKKGSGIVMIKISLRSGNATVLKAKLITNKFKGVTALDVDRKNELAVLAGSDNSLAIVKLKDLSLGRIFKQVHSFAITRVSFSPDSSLIASVSAANTVHVVKVPENFALSTSIWSKLWKLLLNFVSIALIAFLVQTSLKYDLHNRLTKLVRDWYDERRNRAIVKREDSEQVTLVGAVSDVPSSVVPTHSISHGSIATGFEPTTSSFDNLHTPKTSGEATSSTITSVVNTSSEPVSISLSESLVSTTASTNPEPSELSEPSKASSTLTGAIDTVSVSPSSTFEQEISSDTTIETTGSSIATGVFTSITDTSTGSFRDSVVNSLSHHGPTPKPSSSVDTSLESFDKEATDQSMFPKTSTTLDEFSKTTDTVSRTSETVSNYSQTSETSSDPSGAKATTTTALTTSTVPSSGITTNSDEHSASQIGNTGESFVSSSISSPISENLQTVSSKTTTMPTSHIHDQHEKSSSIAISKSSLAPESGQEVKSDSELSSVQTPSSSSKVVSGTEGVSSDEMEAGIAVETPSNTTDSNIYSNSAVAVSNENPSVIAESSAPTSEASETSSSVNPTSASSSTSPIETPVSASTVPSSSSTPSTSEGLGASSVTVTTSEIAVTSETPINGSNAEVTSASPSVSLTTSSESSSEPISESLSSSGTVTASTAVESLQVPESTSMTSEETTSIPSPANFASDTGTSFKSSDANPLSSSSTSTQEKTTPTSNQISDTMHSAEVVPEYGESLQTGSQSSHTSVTPSTTTEDTRSISSAISSQQVFIGSNGTSTPKVHGTTQEANMGGKKDSVQESNDQDDDEKYLEDLEEKVELRN